MSFKAISYLALHHFNTVTEWCSTMSTRLQQRSVCHDAHFCYTLCRNQPTELQVVPKRLLLKCCALWDGITQNREQAGLSLVSEPGFMGAKAGQSCQQPCETRWTNLGQTSVWNLSLGSLSLGQTSEAPHNQWTTEAGGFRYLIWH